MNQAMQQSGLADEMARLQQGLRSARPDLRWGGRQRVDGDTPMDFSDATGALAELADLDQLDDLLGQDYPGASLDDIDEELIERALGRAAVDDVSQLRRIERELRDQGYLQRGSDGLRLTPRALRRLGSTALKRVFDVLESRGRGGHDVRDAGAAGEVTGASREWRFGDEQPLDVVRTVRNAVQRTTRRRHRTRSGVRGLRDRRDRTSLVRRSGVARRHVVLDGAARHLGRGEDDRARPARADQHQVPAGRHRDHRLQRLRAGHEHQRACRTRLGPRAGHEPATRAHARAPASRQASQLRAGHPRDHRRRADRASRA